MAQKIPNKIFRERYQYLAEREGLTLAEVAARLDWHAHDKKSGLPKPDSSRVSRALGIAPEGGEKRQEVSLEHAIQLCLALHVEYCEAGV
jgi:hypothetical protein